MTAYEIIACIKYQWKAKNRHGTHSPFVYRFVDEVLESNTFAAPDDPSANNLSARNRDLLHRINACYNYKTIGVAGDVPDNCDVLLVAGINPQKWVELLDEHIGRINRNGMVFVTGIHSSAAHTAAWNSLCIRAKVRMSIDLYSAGILLFNNEFRENQRFVLRY